MYSQSIKIEVGTIIGAETCRECPPFSFPGTKIEDITERVEKILGPGKGGSILVHVGTNNAEREGITVCLN